MGTRMLPATHFGEQEDARADGDNDCDDDDDYDDDDDDDDDDEWYIAYWYDSTWGMTRRSGGSLLGVMSPCVSSNRMIGINFLTTAHQYP
eukprot:559488-Pyramimonas_sp.AAC.1